MDTYFMVFEGLISSQNAFLSRIRGNDVLHGSKLIYIYIFRPGKIFFQFF